MIRKQKVVGVKCFKYEEKEHKCRECPWWKKEEKKGVERAVHVAMPQKV